MLVFLVCFFKLWKLVIIPLELDPDDVPIAEVMPVLEAAIKSPSYRNTVSLHRVYFHPV